MARDRLPTWPTVSADDFASAYREHARLGRWITEHAPPDVTDQLAAAYDRAHQARATGREAQGETADVSALVAQQRRRDQWVSRHHNEITTWSRLEREVRRYEYRLGQAAAYSRPDHTTALLGQLPERISGVERWQCCRRCDRGLPDPLECHHRGRVSAPNPSTPTSVSTGKELSVQSGRQVSWRSTVRVEDPTRHGSRQCGIGCMPSTARGPIRIATCHRCRNHRNWRGAATSTPDTTSTVGSGCDCFLRL